MYFRRMTLARDARAIHDELLVLRCQRGEVQAFEELFRQWERRLFYYIRRMVPQESDAWDALQKTWLHVLRDIRRLRDAGALRVWLYRLARNTAVSHLRLEQTHRARAEPEVDVEDVPEDDPLLRAENVEYVHRELGRLPLPAREALTLYFLEAMSIEEIAEVLDVPAGTVKSRLHYAKRALRTLLAKEVRP
jgi:RNA polymerase sigma-70 factor, ECF subfamily